jgi:hypothetical protein
MSYVLFPLRNGAGFIIELFRIEHFQVQHCGVSLADRFVTYLGGEARSALAAFDGGLKRPAPPAVFAFSFRQPSVFVTFRPRQPSVFVTLGIRQTLQMVESTTKFSAVGAGTPPRQPPGRQRYCPGALLLRRAALPRLRSGLRSLSACGIALFCRCLAGGRLGACRRLVLRWR